MYRLKIRIAVLLSIFVTVLSLLLKSMQLFDWYTFNLNVMQVVYLFPASFILSIETALVFQYSRGVKTILLYSSFVVLNYLYVILNTKLILLNTMNSFYLVIISSVVYCILNTILLRLVLKQQNDNENVVSTSKSINQILSYLNGCTILICLLALVALVWSILLNLNFTFVIIGMVILFFAIFILNLIKYKFVFNIARLEYSRVVIFDSISVLVGMQFNYVFCKYIFTDGFPAGIVVIVFTLSLVPMLDTNKKIYNVHKLKDFS